VDVSPEFILPAGSIRPANSEPTACRSCRRLILFVQTAKGKLMPIDPDGTSHFATCTEPARWRKRR
jgi:hypothetical protein